MAMSTKAVARPIAHMTNASGPYSIEDIVHGDEYDTPLPWADHSMKAYMHQVNSSPNRRNDLGFEGGPLL